MRWTTTCGLWVVQVGRAGGSWWLAHMTRDDLAWAGLVPDPLAPSSDVVTAAAYSCLTASHRPRRRDRSAPSIVVQCIPLLLHAVYFGRLHGRFSRSIIASIASLLSFLCHERRLSTRASKLRPPATSQPSTRSFLTSHRPSSRDWLEEQTASYNRGSGCFAHRRPWSQWRHGIPRRGEHQPLHSSRCSPHQHWPVQTQSSHGNTKRADAPYGATVGSRASSGQTCPARITGWRRHQTTR